MSDDLKNRSRLNELQDKSILTWLTDTDRKKIIEEFKFLSFSRGQFIHDKFNSNEFVIMVSGKSLLVSKETNSSKESIIPGRSFELINNFLRKEWSYKWLAEDDTVVAVIDFNVLETYLKSANNYEYLSKISTTTELQKFKKDLRMLGISNAVSKEVITNLSKSSELPQEMDLCVVASGSVTIKDSSNNKAVRELKISDYLTFKSSNLVSLAIEKNSQFWILPATNPIIRKLDHSTVSFFDIIGELEAKMLKDSGDIEEDIEEEPEVIDDFEIEYFNKSNTQKLLSTKSKPVAIRQNDTMDCGAACMSMISQYYKRHISIGTWRRLIHITREGSSMLSIKTAASKVGFDTIGIMSGVSALKNFSTPFIALMEYHYVVIYKITDKIVTIADPARGLIELGIEEFKKDYSSNCLLIRPNKNLFSYPESPAAYKKYLSLFKPHSMDLLQILTFSSLLFFLNLAPPLFTQYIFDTVLPSGKSESMKVLAIGAISFSIVVMFLSIIRQSFMIKIASIISLKLSSLFFIQILRLPFGYFTVRNVGDITTRVDELDKIRAFFTNDSIAIFKNVLAIVVYTSILLIYHSYFSYLILITIIIVLLVISPISKKLKELSQDLFHSMGGANSIAFEQFSSLRTIQSITGSMQARWRWEEKQSKVLEKRQSIQGKVATVMSISSLMQQLINLSFLTLAIYLFLDRQITIGQVVASISISGMIIGPILSLIQSVDNIGQVKVSLEKVDEIVTSKIEDESFLTPFPQNFKKIEFKDIWFRYGSDFSPWILKNINLEVKQGQKIAFVGPSGSGKSTLSYMLNLIYQAQKGHVLFDGVSNSEINLKELRANISMIVQDNSVLFGTVLSNITLGDPYPDFVKATDAAKLAEAHDFIMSLPEGYQTKIGGEHGTNMSGGEKQRIGIARAIYKAPSIMVMDEATSALDTITERKVMNNLFQNLKKTTCFIIAHRFNTIMNADVIVVLKEGKIKEMGSHEVLMKKQNFYYEMFRKQINL